MGVLILLGFITVLSEREGSGLARSPSGSAGSLHLDLAMLWALATV